MNEGKILGAAGKEASWACLRRCPWPLPLETTRIELPPSSVVFVGGPLKSFVGVGDI